MNIEKLLLESYRVLFESEDNADLIELLNEDIRGLYKAVVQYNRHAAMITGPEYQGYVEDLKNHAIDDMAQAVELCDKVVYYGGKPAVTVPEVDVAESAKAMIKLDEQLQSGNVETYKSRVEFCRENNYPAMEAFYMELVKHEEEHHNTTQNYLNKKIPA